METGASDLVLLFWRLVIGGVMAAHGWNHSFGGGGIEGTARWFASMGMRWGRLQAWLAGVTEVGAALLLAAGLLTPLAGAAVLGVMIVAWSIAHRRNGFFIFRPGQGWEYVMVLGVSGLVLATVGPGRWSLDHALGILDPPGWTGLAIAVLAGGGAAAALLAAAWRPAGVSARPDER